MSKVTRKSYSVTETAVFVRQALKKAFPGIKFSVKSDSYAGGASIRVEYTNGPKESEVDSVVSQFEGSTFNSMIDLKSYVDTVFNGELVHFGADSVGVTRHHTDDVVKAFCYAIAEDRGADAPVFEINKWGNLNIVQNNRHEAYGNQDLWLLFGREFRNWDEKDGLPQSANDLPSVKESLQWMADYQAKQAVLEAQKAPESVETVKPISNVIQVTKTGVTAKNNRDDWKCW